VKSEDLENATQLTIGGWYLDKFTVPPELTKWHVVNDDRRVAAQISALKVGEKWVFQNLRFVSAKILPSRSK
jgi:hypothetical protein